MIPAVSMENDRLWALEWENILSIVIRFQRLTIGNPNNKKPQESIKSLIKCLIVWLWSVIPLIKMHWLRSDLHVSIASKKEFKLWAFCVVVVISKYSRKRKQCLFKYNKCLNTWYWTKMYLWCTFASKTAYTWLSTEVWLNEYYFSFWRTDFDWEFRCEFLSKKTFQTRLILDMKETGEKELCSNLRNHR